MMVYSPLAGIFIASHDTPNLVGKWTCHQTVYVWVITLQTDLVHGLFCSIIYKYVAKGQNSSNSKEISDVGGSYWSQSLQYWPLYSFRKIKKSFTKTHAQFSYMYIVLVPGPWGGGGGRVARGRISPYTHRKGGHCSRRYTSYWNALLFDHCFPHTVPEPRYSANLPYSRALVIY